MTTRFLLFLLSFVAFTPAGNAQSLPFDEVTRILAKQEAISQEEAQTLYDFVDEGIIRDQIDYLCVWHTAIMARGDYSLAKMISQRPDTLPSISGFTHKKWQEEDPYCSDDTLVIDTAFENKSAQAQTVDYQSREYLEYAKKSKKRHRKTFRSLAILGLIDESTKEKALQRLETDPEMALWNMGQILAFSIDQQKGREAKPTRPMTDRDRFPNFYRFRAKTAAVYHEQMAKYSFRSIPIPLDYLQAPLDPARLFRHVLDSLSNLPFEVTDNYYSKDSVWLMTDIRIGTDTFYYQSKNGLSWFNWERLNTSFGQLSRVFNNTDTLIAPISIEGEAPMVLWGSKKDFYAAIEEGFPIDHPDRHWTIPKDTIDGIERFYFPATNLPPYTKIETQLLIALRQLDSLGFMVPLLNRKRLDIDDFASQQNIDIAINGLNSRENSIVFINQSLVIPNTGYGGVVLWMLWQQPEAEVIVLSPSQGQILMSFEAFEKSFFSRLARK